MRKKKYFSILFHKYKLHQILKISREFSTLMNFRLNLPPALESKQRKLNTITLHNFSQNFNITKIFHVSYFCKIRLVFEKYLPKTDYFTNYLPLCSPKDVTFYLKI
jgi:hypothetical protein